MATTTTDRVCWVDLTNPFGSGLSYRQVLCKESGKVTIRIPDSIKYGTGTFLEELKFTVTLRKESN